MTEPDRYIPGVPCWIDTTQPDPDAAAKFYGGLFGWELEETHARRFAPAIPPGPPERRRRRRRQLAPEGAPPAATWNTYI